jgi:choline dehydrogenase
MPGGGNWDYIVVGAGSAGAVVAARLSENPARRVLLLEAGGTDWSPAIHVPGLVEQVITSRRLNWHFAGEPDPSLGGRSLTWAAGRVLGGSSSINGMVYGRGLPADYAAWVDAGNPGWGWADMLPVFRKIEDWQGTPHDSRGTGGPLAVRPFTETDASCRATMEAFVGAGVPFVDDYSVGIAEGIGLTQATQKAGWRHSVAGAYLRPARRRRNLRVLTGARAERLTIERGRCTGLYYRRNGTLHRARADREVIVSAGAIGTPKLLLLSGIGAPDSFAAHGIAVAHALPGVGRGLNDHVNVKLSAFVTLPTYNTQRRGLAALRHGARFLRQGRGPASSPANHVQAFVKTDRALPSADVQVQLMALGFGSAAEMRQNGITAVVSPCRPEVRGCVSLRSANPADPPRIAISMLESARDIATLLKGCALAYEMIEAGPGQRHGARIYAPGGRAPDDAGWRDFFRQTAALNWHPTSTCRMGQDEGAVVDATLRVHGLDGLSIADASVMPSVTSANTNIPVIAIAERAAGFVAARTA